MNPTINVLKRLLTNLKSLGTIEASAIVSRDGILICSDMPEGVVAETFAAMSATMLGAAETATIELKKGLPGKVIVESKNSKLICMGAGPKALLIVMAEPEAGLGLILIELEKTVARIKEIM